MNKREQARHFRAVTFGDGPNAFRATVLRDPLGAVSLEPLDGEQKGSEFCIYPEQLRPLLHWLLRKLRGSTEEQIIEGRYSENAFTARTQEEGGAFLKRSDDFVDGTFTISTDALVNFTHWLAVKVDGNRELQVEQ